MVLPVVRECLENAQAIRRKLAESDLSLIPGGNGYLGERLVRQERMLEYLLAAVAYMAGDDCTNILFGTFDETGVKGIGGAV
jgi:hypothetical protein